MSASKPSIPGVFYPDEIEDMRVELSSGDVPNETAVERGSCARDHLAKYEQVRPRGQRRKKAVGRNPLTAGVST